MKKRLIGIILVIIITVGLIITFITKQKTVYTEIDGVKYSILVNGQSANSFPSGNYKVDVDCTNAKGYWDAVQQKVIIKDITGIASCCVEFLSITSSDYLNNYVISLENDTNQGDGAVIHETVSEFTTMDNITTEEAGYRYEGKNPNNYIWFNNELWRIIGVFGPESHGQTGKQLVKIIRNDSIGSLVWNSTIDLKSLLNNAFYNHSIDTTNCYGNYSSGGVIEQVICDYTISGIQNDYHDFIQSVTWYLEGSTNYNFTLTNHYQAERQGSLKETNNIGLMYKSDYLYGSLEDDCDRTITEVNNYKSLNCFGKNWLNKYSNEWNSIKYIGDKSNGRDTRPVLYLSSSVYKVSGTGTLLDPYIIGLVSS